MKILWAFLFFLTLTKTVESMTCFDEKLPKIMGTTLAMTHVYTIDIDSNGNIVVGMGTSDPHLL